MLEIRNITKEFSMHVGEEKTIGCLDSVSVTVAPGKLLALVGPSGAGKSSLLKCVYGTYLPTAGQILYTDRSNTVHDLAAADLQTMRSLRQNEIGYVSQFFHVIPRISAMDILCEPLLAAGVSAESARERAGGLFRMVNLPESLWSMYPSTFSGGEKQRLNILYGLIRKPRLLLLDEPTASLDAKSKESVLELILELKAGGSVILGAFHDPYAIGKVADQTYHIVTKAEEYIA